MKVSEIQTGDKFLFGGREYTATGQGYEDYEICAYIYNDKTYHVDIIGYELVDKEPIKLNTLERGDKFKVENNWSLEQELQKLGIDDWTIFHITNKVDNATKEHGKKEYYRGYKIGKEEGVSELKENLQEFLKRE